MRCSHCNTELEAGLRVCTTCGQALPPESQEEKPETPSRRQVVSTAQVRGASSGGRAGQEGVKAAEKYRSQMQEASKRHMREDAQAMNPARRGSIRPAPGQGSRGNLVQGASARSTAHGSSRRNPSPAVRPSASRPLPPRKAPPEGARREIRARVPLREVNPRPVADDFSWIRLLIVAAVCVAMLTSSVYFFLRASDQGQLLLASWNMEASGDAYATLGRQRMVEGNIIQAIQYLEIAQSKDPNNLEILMDLGTAYEANNRLDRAELAYRRAIQFYAIYPEPYRRIIALFLETDREYEALQCMQLAYEATKDETFQDMLSAARPSYPRVNKLGGNYPEEFELELSSPDGGEIRYTLDGSDPYFGAVYGTPIYMAEGGWTLRAVTIMGNLVSDEQKQTYYVRKPSPDMPKTNLSTGTYSSVRTVGLRAGEDVVAIYYTTDGSEATVDSKLYTGPIQLRVGKTTIRAVAVNSAGKVSNELSATYKCEGNAKTSLLEKDVFTNLSLFSTTQEAFIKRFGEPLAQEYLDSDSLGEYNMLRYPFGYAVFLTRKADSQPVLAELSTKDSTMVGPRGVKVGMDLSDAIALFRDEGGEDDGHGNRILYNLTSGNMGLLHNMGDGIHEVRYYTKLEKDYIELALFAEDEVIVRIEWLRYRVGS